jgi:hypothetical protein
MAVLGQVPRRAVGKRCIAGDVIPDKLADFGGSARDFALSARTLPSGRRRSSPGCRGCHSGLSVAPGAVLGELFAHAAAVGARLMVEDEDQAKAELTK